MRRIQERSPQITYTFYVLCFTLYNGDVAFQIDYDIHDVAWDTFVERRADGHVLQTSAWAALKSRFGWSASRVAILDNAQIVAGASILFRQLPLRLGTLAYVPKGPLVDWDNAPLVSELFDGLDALCRTRRAFALKLEPDVECRMTNVECRTISFDNSTFDIRPSSFVQPRRTILLDLTRTEEEILAAMHQKTRYNIRLAARKGVVIREGAVDDLPAFHALMQTTGARDGFGVHSADYYRAAFELFVPRGRARLFVAELPEADNVVPCINPIAAIMVFALGSKAWYMYGASGDAHREKMPNHALQWEAIRWAKSHGCASYDLWGVPDEDEESLEAQYLARTDGLWSVYRFKRGFGGRLVRYVGVFDRVYNPLLYRAYLFALQRRGGIE
jgi:lipid II:glycine glycyltransferase (peptidoglycan interpeptide bridge formation enzyme)